jgi:manganese/zinc/iron transport system substrate-binding protein
MRHLSLFFLVLIIFSCSTPKNNTHQILCTTSIVTDIVRNILPQNFEVKSLMGHGVDPHSYKSTAKDNDLLVSASAFGLSGLNIEQKLEPVFNEFAKKKPVISISDGVLTNDLITLNTEKTKFDPHIWMDIKMMMDGVKYLSKQFVLAFPNDKDSIEQKTNLYLNELQNAFEYMDSLVQLIPKEKRVLITAHNAFSYFGKRFNFEVKSLQGVSTLSESSLKDKKNLVDFIVENKIPAVFIEHAVNAKNIESLVEACSFNNWQVKIGKPLYSDSFGEINTPQGNYIGMQKYNALVIYEALK